MNRTRPTLLLVLGVAIGSACAKSSSDDDRDVPRGSGGSMASGGSGGSATSSGGGGGQAAGGAGVQGGDTAVAPVKMGDVYRFAFADVLLEVDPQVGGRIVRFAHAGTNVLTGKDVNATNWGATIWPSPQKIWNWPPPAEIDSDEYTAIIDGTTLVLQSKVHNGTGLKLEKRFRAEPPRIVQIFTLTNTGANARNWGVWQVTRVPPDGLTVFGLGDGGSFTHGTWQPLPAETAAGTLWITHQPSALIKAYKTFADGRGWLAHVLPASRLVLLKTFADVPNNAWAEDEGEIEIFADGAGKYVEIEAQSVAKMLGQNESVSWQVTWQLAPLPAGAEPVAKNAALLTFIDSLR